MRMFLRAVICSVLVALISVFGASAVSAGGGPLSGTWESTDWDGSSQHLRITGSGQGSYAMFLVDEGASACGGSPAAAVGSGVVHDDTLTMFATLTCRPGGNFLSGRLTVDFVYSPATDTLTDQLGVTWYR